MEKNYVGKGEEDGNFGEENQDFKGKWGRISSCKEFYSPLTTGQGLFNVLHVVPEGISRRMRRCRGRWPPGTGRGCPA